MAHPIALGVLFAIDFGLLRGLPPGSGLLSMLVAVVGVGLLLAGTLWAALRGGSAMARSRAMRAAFYVVLGVSAIATVRLRGQPLKDFHAHLTPGMIIQDVLQRLDEVYARHPREWNHVAVWGTSREWALVDVHEAARTVDTLPVFNWHAAAQSRADIAAAAKGLGAARQVWFTFRTATGYMQFFVTLDGAGRVREVSKLTGHQA